MKYRDAAVLGDALEVVTIPMGDGFEQSIVRKRDEAVLVSAKTGVARIDLGRRLDDVPTLRSTHAVQFDDIDARHALSLDAALRGFERARSTFLGGPDALAGLQAQDLTVVVCRVDQLRYQSKPVRELDTVHFNASCRLRSSRFIVFDQDVEVAGSLAARAQVTCVCLDTPSGKPIAVPDSVRAELQRALY